MRLAAPARLGCTRVFITGCFVSGELDLTLHLLRIYEIINSIVFALSRCLGESFSRMFISGGSRAPLHFLHIHTQVCTCIHTPTCPLTSAHSPYPAPHPPTHTHTHTACNSIDTSLSATHTLKTPTHILTPSHSATYTHPSITQTHI